MRKLIIIFVSHIFFSGLLYSREATAFSQKNKIDTIPTPQLIVYLEQLNINQFTGMPVDSFLTTIPSNFYNLKVYGGSHSQGAIRRASFLSVNFTPDLYGPRAFIYVSDFSHMNRYSATSTWDVGLFRQEKIYRIEIWKNQNTLISGN